MSTSASSAVGANPKRAGNGPSHTLSRLSDARLSRLIRDPGRCSSTAACTSLAKTPLPPKSEIGTASMLAACSVAATSLPVSADLENAYADDPAGAAETMRLAIEVGLRGSIYEAGDWTGLRAGLGLRERGRLSTSTSGALAGAAILIGIGFSYYFLLPAAVLGALAAIIISVSSASDSAWRPRRCAIE